MDKKNKILTLIMVIFMLASIILTFKRAFIDRNFIIENPPPETAEIET